MPEKKLLFLFLSVWLSLYSLFHPSLSQAQSSVSVTARIPDETPPTPPILIAPENGSYSSINQPTFIFKKATDAQSPVRHYVMYLNSQVFISEIPSSQTPVETDFFYCIITNETVSVTLKNSLEDALYTWKIRAYDMYGNWSDSAAWTFTIDTIPPFVILDTIGENLNLNLSSENLEAFSTNLTFSTSQ